MFELLVQPVVYETALAAWMAGVASVRALDWRESRRHIKRARVLIREGEGGVPELPERVPRPPQDDWGVESEAWQRPKAVVPAPPEPAKSSVSSPVAGVQPGSCPGASVAQCQPRHDPAPGRLMMRPLDHLTEYLGHIRAEKLGINPFTGRWELKASDRWWVNDYRRWAHARGIVVIPGSMFLGLMSKAALAGGGGVKKSRDRIKDGDGRVLRNAAGTPLRETNYTVFALAQAQKAAPKPARAPVMTASERARRLAELERDEVPRRKAA